MRADKELRDASLQRELCEERVEAAGRPSKPKKDKVTGKENNRAFVERALLKLKPDRQPCKKTPGIVRLMDMIEYKPIDDKFTNMDLHVAAQAFLRKPADAGDVAAMSEATAAKLALKHAREAERVAGLAYDKSVEKAKWRVWRRARLVACTAAAAVHVTRRLAQALDDEGLLEEDGGRSFGDDGEDEALMQLEYVVLDEAGALLEPDAVGCLLHGARALLLVGDHYQLPPFSKWQAAERERYNVSLMERLVAGGGGGGGGGHRGGDKRVEAGFGGGAPAFVLRQQYRMHPAIAQAVSATFYSNRLVTAAETAAARTNPLPAAFVAVYGHEQRRAGSTSITNEAEANAVVDLVAALVRKGVYAQAEVNVLTFYNGQRSLIARKLMAAQLPEVQAISVDSMQGREEDLIVLSCVRTERGGLGFLSDWRRVNVAVSRAKEQLVVVGDPDALASNRMWSNLLQRLARFDGGRQWLQALLQAEAVDAWLTPYRRRKDLEAQARNQTIIMGLLQASTCALEAAAGAGGEASAAAAAEAGGGDGLGGVGTGVWFGGGSGWDGNEEDSGFWDDDEAAGGSAATHDHTGNGGIGGGAVPETWSDEEEEEEVIVSSPSVPRIHVCVCVCVCVCVRACVCISYHTIQSSTGPSAAHKRASNECTAHPRLCLHSTP